VAHPGYPNQGSVPHEREAGTIIVDTGSKHLYYVGMHPDDTAWPISDGSLVPWMR
jgi:hypothetical protein